MTDIRSRLRALHIPCDGDALTLLHPLVSMMRPSAPAWFAGRTCLHYAAGYGFEQALDVLLSKKGVEVGLVDNKGDTPLHLAAAQGHPMCAFNLTKAEPRGCLKANKAGQSPLDMAVACDRGEASYQRTPCGPACGRLLTLGSTHWWPRAVGHWVLYRASHEGCLGAGAERHAPCMRKHQVG